ncbi:iron-containing alcohol dehydrogenase [Bacteroidota bacterium]
MTHSFNFSKIPQIIFGNGTLNQVKNELLIFGENVLLVLGKGSFIHSRKGIDFLQNLKKEKCISSINHITQEPTPNIIDRIVEENRSHKPDAVVAIGGGSVLDSGKAISAMLPVEGSVKDYLEGVGTKMHPGKKIPFIALPTTSGTGSEITKNAVITQTGKNGFKKSLRHDNFVPDIAIIDPELTLNCPFEITTRSGMDAFTQLLESYLSSISNPLTDSLALKGLSLIKKSFIKSCFEENNIEARSDMAMAAMLSGITLANSGLGLIHGFASSVGGMYNIPHGVICGSLMAITNDVMINKLREQKENRITLQKYIEVAKIFVEDKIDNEDKLLKEFVRYLYHITKLLNIPKLGGFGVNERSLNELISNTSHKYNPVRLDESEFKSILRSRF